MTQEDKQLLLKDLCARLPYEVILLAPNKKITYQTDGNTGAELLVEEEWKPYLRSMNDMTEEEYNSVNWNGCQHTISYDSDGFHFKSIKTFTLEIFYWLLKLKKKFDFMGLIEKGLAIRVTKENNPYEKFL